MQTIIEGKKVLRKQMRQLIKHLSIEEKQKASDIICDILAHTPGWIKAKSILLYYPLPDEPDITPLLAQALNAGKKLLLPQFNFSSRVYDTAPIYNLKTDLQPGQFGILEPITQAVELESIDMTLVPGLGFDRAGHRLGRGKGYYDRLLPHFTSLKCGVSWSGCILETIPTQEHDVCMNALVSPHTGYCIAHE